MPVAISKLVQFVTGETEHDLGRAETEPGWGPSTTVMIDSSLWLEADRPIVCRPRRLELARGTVPPTLSDAAVYCVIESGDSDGIPQPIESPLVANGIPTPIDD